MEKQKRVLAIHDTSCVGRCSLTVALPILAAAGADCAVMPTAILSTHTGGFTGFTFRDLTADMLPVARHWKDLDLRFDAIYTGYLGSSEQIDIVKEIIDMFRTDETTVLVDPAMADNGKLYTSFSDDFPMLMRSLCSKADIVIPNFTEAALMLGEPYIEPPYTDEYIEKAVIRLRDKLGVPCAVLTGTDIGDGQLGAISYDGKEISRAGAGKIDGYFHGTGDVFGSAFLAGVINGLDMRESMRLACDYTRECIRRTVELGQEERYGVCFEKVLPMLIERIAGNV